MDSGERNDKRITIVQYDLTSSDDTDSDRQSYIYWSSKQSPPHKITYQEEMSTDSSSCDKSPEMVPATE